MNRREFVAATSASAAVTLAGLALPRPAHGAAASVQSVVLGQDRPRTAHGPAADAHSRQAACSTFKIPLTLMALESGVVRDPDALVELDAQTYQPRDWWSDGMRRNWGRPHSLRSAFKSSAVWFYRRLALRMGTSTVAAFLESFDYGDRNMAAGLDNFWNAGPRAVRISPLEQWQFLHRVAHRRLALSQRSFDLAHEVFVHEQRPEAVVHAKTGLGWLGEDADSGLVGWFVGWTRSTADGQITPFASLRTGQGNEVMSARIDQAMHALQQAGALR